MIKSVKITNYLGDSLILNLRSPELSGFLVKYIDGLGPVKANINTTEVSTNDGSIFNSARTVSRNIVIGLDFSHALDVESQRQLSYKFFPIKKNLELVLETSNRILVTKGYVESNEPNIFSDKEGTVLSILCPDPYLYSLEKNITVFSGSGALFTFPFCNNSISTPLLKFADIQNLTENVIAYNGDSEIGIEIVIHAIGQAGTVTIYNTGTRETMVIDNDKITALTGAGISSGDEITINTVKGDKRISLLRDGISTNILNCLTRGSAWFKLVKGDNIFAYSAYSGSSNLQFRIENRIAYEGA